MNIFGSARSGLIALFFVMMATVLPMSPATAQTITSFSPSSGPMTGGTDVTIVGTNLGSVTSVSIGEDATIVSRTATEIVARTNARSIGGAFSVILFSGGPPVQSTVFFYVCRAANNLSIAHQWF